MARREFADAAFTRVRVQKKTPDFFDRFEMGWVDIDQRDRSTDSATSSPNKEPVTPASTENL